MRKIICSLILLSFLCSCKKKDDTTEKLYFVKYSATWQGYTLGTCYYHYLTYRIGDSTIKFDEFYLLDAGSMTYEYKAKLHDTLKIYFFSYQPYGTTPYDTIKIFYNNQLVRSASDSCIYVIDQ